MESIENVIMRGLLFNDDYASKVYPYLKDEYFDGTIKTLFNSYAYLFDKYNKKPTMEALLLYLQKLPLNEDVFKDSVGVLEEIYKNRKEVVDFDWLVDETEEYCSDKATYNAVYDSIQILEGNDKKRDKHFIPELLSDAISIGFDQELGSDYFEDAESRYAYYTNPESKLALPLEALQILTNGGLPPKTLNVFLAGVNIGKSSLMCFLAGELVKQGKNVLYVSAEMSEEALYERIDANLLDVTTDQLKNPELDKEWFLGSLKKLKQRGAGRYFAKEYPTSSAHSGHIKQLLKELKQKKKFKPDIIFLDYINIFTSSRYKTLNGVNSYSYIKAISEEMRGLAVEECVPIVSATQLNRDGMSSLQPDMTNTSESMGLPASCDFMAAIVTNENLMELNQQLIIQLKTRYGAKTSQSKSQLVGIDFSKMRYTDINSMGGSEAEFKPMQDAKKTKAKFEKSKTEDWVME
jgi:archaellum biogenesis ATPase FlaH